MLICAVGGGCVLDVQDHPYVKSFALTFGGLNAVYCNADTWMLELAWRSR